MLKKEQFHGAMEFSSLPEIGSNPACVLDAFVVGKTGAHDEFSGVVHSALPDNENS